MLVAGGCVRGIVHVDVAVAAGAAAGAAAVAAVVLPARTGAAFDCTAIVIGGRGWWPLNTVVGIGGR